MKTLCSLLLAAVSCLVVQAQQNDSELKYAVLTGKVSITWSHQLRLGITNIPLATDGSFNYSLHINNVGCYTLQHENKTLQLCITPGDSLHLNLDGAGVIITGSSGQLNTSLQEHVKVFKRNVAFLDDNNKAVFSQQLDAFNMIIDSLKLSEITSLQKFITKNSGLSEALISNLQLDVVHRSKFYKLLYPHNYNRHTGKLAAVKSDYFANITQGSFDHPELLSSDSFLRLFLLIPHPKQRP